MELNLSFRIFIKDTDKHLRLKIFRFELFGQNNIILEHPFPVNKEKVIHISTHDNDILEFNYKKNHYAGVDQYYNFVCELIKKEENIEVETVRIKYSILDDTTKMFTSSNFK